MKYLAALRDPVTGHIFTGQTHAQALESVPKNDASLYRRMMREFSAKTANTGFLIVAEIERFLTREETKEKYGFSTSEEMGRFLCE